MTRRDVLRLMARAGLLTALGGLGVWLARRGGTAVCRAGSAACADCGQRWACGAADGMVWQLDPAKCVQCGQCATQCVLSPSAVKCYHTHAMCGHCELCFGYFDPEAKELTSAAENQLCPTGAIQRRFVEDPYYAYTIDEDLCVGCGKCVRGCGLFGNGSLYLQVNHALCVNCNACAIAEACPVNAFRRVPASQPYLLKGKA